MSMVIGTNIASLTAQRHLASSRLDMETSMERLASGSRINSAMDDAAGLAIAGRMTAQVQGLDQAVNRQAINPEPGSNWVFAVSWWLEPSVFGDGEKFSLQGEISQCVADHQGKKYHGS